MNRISKKLLAFIVLAFLYVVSPTTIMAAGHKEVGFSSDRINSCKTDGTCILLCGYTNEVNIVQYPPDASTIYSSYIYYSIKEDKFFVEWYTYNTSKPHKKDWIASEVIKSPSAQNSLQNGVCPKQSYADDYYVSEVCFDDGGGHCKAQSDNGKWNLIWTTVFSGTSKLEYNYLEKEFGPWLEQWAYGYGLECTDLVGVTKDEFKKMVESKFTQDWKNYIDAKDFAHGLPDFMNKILDKEFEKVYSSSYQSFYNTCQVELEEAVDNGDITEEEKNETLENIEITQDEHNEIADNTIENLQKEYPYTGNYTCGIFGEKTWGYIKMLYTLIRIAIPAVVIVLGMIDFATIVFSGEEKDMKASAQRFLKRVIIGIVFILLPYLIQFIFELVGFSEDCLQHLI